MNDNNIELYDIIVSEVHNQNIDNIYSTALEATKKFDNLTSKQKEEWKKLKSNYTDILSKSHILRDNIMEIINNKYRKNERKLFNYIAKYRDQNIEILASPYITKNMIFTDADKDIVFNCLETSEKEIENILKQVEEAPGEIGRTNITPLRIVLLLLIRHYMILNKEREMNMIISYYSYSQYYSSYSSRFRYGVLSEATMKYAIDNMSNKFYLKKIGSVEKLIVNTAQTAIETYKAQLKNASDFDIMYIIDQLISRANGMMTKIKDEYTKAYKENKVSYDADLVKDSEGNIIEFEANSAKVDRMAHEFTNAFFTKPININTINIVTKSIIVSKTELRVALEVIQSKRKISELLEFYRALFSAVYSISTKNDDTDKRGTVFIGLANSIYAKGNSNDPNIKAIKRLSHKWLEDGSSSYRASNNAGTQNSFRKAIYFYFVFEASNIIK